jgi:hypothetical protein
LPPRWECSIASLICDGLYVAVIGKLEEAFKLNDKLLNHATMMEESGSDNRANRATLAVLRLHLKRLIVNTVRRFMRPGDKAELEKLFESVAKTISETRTEIAQRRYVDRVRAKQLLDDLDGLEGLASDYKTEIFTEKVKG